MTGKPLYIVVTPFFPSPDNWRGAYCYDFVVALKKTGRYRVEVFVPGKGGDYTIGDVRVHGFATRQLPSNISPFIFSGWNQKSFLRAVEESGIKIEDVAICHGHTANLGIYPLAVKRMNNGCLTLLHHHDKESFGLNMGMFRHCWLYNMIEFPILRTLHEKIDCHVFISEASRRNFLLAPKTDGEIYEGYIRQMRWLPYRPVKIQNSIILHNGVNIQIFNKGMGDKPNRPTPGDRMHRQLCQWQRSRDLAQSCREGLIACIANFIDWKNQITLLRAVRLLQEKEMKIKVIFIGSGPEMEKCRRFVKANNIDAEFRTEVEHAALPDLYRAIDLFVLPSYFEGFGCVFTESWACGTPFITCEGQGMDDLIPAEVRNLWLCKPRDPEDLAAKIKYYIENRPAQQLKGEIDIDKLVPEFVRNVETIRADMLTRQKGA